jgi:hypothetical protein
LVGDIFLTMIAEIKNKTRMITALISKKMRNEFSLGVINEINQLPRPITGGYSIEFVGER